MQLARWTIILAYLILAALPLAWMGITSLKHYDDSISRNARFLPSLNATSSDRSALFPATTEGYAKLAQPMRSSGNSFYHFLLNSVIIGVCSTVASVTLGTAAAYGF